MTGTEHVRVPRVAGDPGRPGVAYFCRACETSWPCASARAAAEGVDPVSVLDDLGAVWSPNFDDYATGKIGAEGIICALCLHCPCDCPPFGTPEYFALIDRRRGKGDKQ
jgi:hypothetical protein